MLTREHPEKLIALQRSYALAGTQIIYAPTFQAQPIVLERVCLDRQTETVNAGLPTICDDGIARYSMGSEEFGRIMKDCHAMGATLLGGCCGTTPEHIKALK